MIGHASCDEYSRGYGGNAGDQTGREVCVRTWYNGSWNKVIRPKSRDIAEKMASACETLCKFNKVGYDMGQRNDLWDELEKVNWQTSALTKQTETDCSAFMTACARCAGIDVPRTPLGNGKYNAPVTQNMVSRFKSTGQFEILSESKYLTSDKYLRRGDILVRESGHTAMNLTDGAYAVTTQPTASTQSTGSTVNVGTAPKSVKATEPAHYFSKNLKGIYTVTVSALNIRDGAGTSKKMLTSIQHGTTVNCEGYYNIYDGVKWLYIWFVQGNVTYSAFACSTYLKMLNKE